MYPCSTYFLLKAHSSFPLCSYLEYPLNFIPKSVPVCLHLILSHHHLHSRADWLKTAPSERGLRAAKFFLWPLFHGHSFQIVLMTWFSYTKIYRDNVFTFCVMKREFFSVLLETKYASLTMGSNILKTWRNWGDCNHTPYSAVARRSFLVEAWMVEFTSLLFF